MKKLVSCYKWHNPHLRKLFHCSLMHATSNRRDQELSPKQKSKYEQWCQPALNVQSLISTLAILKEDSGPVGQSTRNYVWSMYSGHPTAPVPPPGPEFLVSPYVIRTKFFDAASENQSNFVPSM